MVACFRRPQAAVACAAAAIWCVIESSQADTGTLTATGGNAVGLPNAQSTNSTPHAEARRQ
jgi:hypothetical protein